MAKKSKKHQPEHVEQQEKRNEPRRADHLKHTGQSEGWNKPEQSLQLGQEDRPKQDGQPDGQEVRRQEELHAAFSSHDPRFDGRIFVGVSSTGIYCRPICRARPPKRENCTYFESAAEAESAGYRPCLKCRPEIAPGISTADSRQSLVRRAASLMHEECTSGLGVEHLAEKLGYTSRHMRRAFEEEFHVTPVEYLQTCRLLLAKSLLTDTRMKVSDVARAAGFKSTRRLNDLFKTHYRLTPTQFRNKGGKSENPGSMVLMLGYRAPYRFDRLLQFFKYRQLEGVERIDDESYSRTVSIALPDGGVAQGWMRVSNDAAHNRLTLKMSDSLAPAVSQVASRTRRVFDLDCDPQSVAEGIASLDDVVPGAVVEGTRVPGAFEPFEIACRAVLGQQVSVVAANKMAARIVSAYGSRIDTGIEGLDRLFPTPQEVLALGDVADAFGQLGVIGTRSRCIAEMAQLIVDGELDITPHAEPDQAIERLVSIKGIGPWTANYIAMRAMSHSDAFLETDIGIKHALPDLTPKERLKAAEAWRPWRSYANISLWNSLG